MSANRKMNMRKPRRHAFTLIELLVAIVIIVIIIAMVVGVANYVFEEAARKQTQTTQNIVMTAVEEYKKLMGQYPADKAYTDQYDNTDVKTKYKDSNTILMLCLLGGEDGDPMGMYPYKHPWFKGLKVGPMILERDRLKARIKKAMGKKLGELSPDVLDTSNFWILDGWEIPMRYEQFGGLGKRPVLISAGPDGEFSTEDDNIRSGEY